MNDLQRHRLVFKVLMPFVSVFTRWKFNYEYDSLKDIEGPYLLLPNHNLELDPVIIGQAAGRQIYFVASEHLTRKGLATRLLMYFFRPIIHMKGRQGARTVKQMLRTLQEGHSVCIFPEGNRSFNGVTMKMQSSIARVAKKARVKLITYRVEGGYLTQPRWATNLRKGKLRGRLIHIYTPEQLAQMSDEQINEAIISDLHEDAYETQKREQIRFRGQKLALGLESTIFYCPNCKTFGKLYSGDQRLYCDCGFCAEYDEYGMLTDQKGRKYTVTELDKLQKEALEKKYVQEDDTAKLLFEDSVTVCRINDNHEQIEKENGIFRAYPDRLECAGVYLDFEAMEGMAVYSRNALIIHHEKIEGHLEIKAGIGFNALKYLYLFELVKAEKHK